MNSLELFAGAGGLAIGMANAGFHHAAVVEWDRDACNTFRENQKRHSTAVDGWPVHQMDARAFEYSQIVQDIAVVSGGPPCQPFSLGGKHAAHDDKRDMFPEAVRAVRELQPKAFIFENVKGLTRKSFEKYFSYILLQLQFPSLEKLETETWQKHLLRLQRHAEVFEPVYQVLHKVLNAANFGVPQKRERVFFVGFRSDLGITWNFPRQTHSEESLIAAKWITGTYWSEHGLPKNRMKNPPVRLKNRIEQIRSDESLISALRWRTTRDAISGLPDPQAPQSAGIYNHLYTPGARTYTGHTGSSLDEPAKTLKAGYHGVPGGENMLIRDDGTVRYFTVREAARIQTFPDDYLFHGSWSQTMRQLGNAVPVLLGQVVAKSVAKQLAKLR